VAWLALKYWDEPVRAWLTHRFPTKGIHSKAPRITLNRTAVIWESCRFNRCLKAAM
jgi:hypothetical protein